MGYHVECVSSRAVSSWSRSPGGCGCRGVFWVGRIFFVFIFFFISSNAHGLLPVRGHLASCTSLVVYQVQKYLDRHVLSCLPVPRLPGGRKD